MKNLLEDVCYRLWLVPYARNRKLRFELEFDMVKKESTMNEIFYGRLGKNKVLPCVILKDSSKPSLEKWIGLMTEKWNSGELKEFCWTRN